ncbi:Probable bifunctional folylpolyglutamate synthase/dihydropteroate synthase [Seminavis robusta]|uniref:Probable bifunctional folylpolyglutamate synthase/dihydropteroate synthase n=1 Tax=Seminavis robusta TaxID=568900 RepID=A0A9N8HA38_9STRA|nr:Probable bifunctional folylpolyglutamate synthase/dihydropteroate synthase [Seminavis robusta]|eukprot:Sro228_g092650.1 Probable bifunctional folylpolyglutamate synthase/dihydropteroate synthase (594) ;mRNA; r:39207-41063
MNSLYLSRRPLLWHPTILGAAARCPTTSSTTATAAARLRISSQRFLCSGTSFPQHYHRQGARGTAARHVFHYQKPTPLTVRCGSSSTQDGTSSQDTATGTISNNNANSTEFSSWEDKKDAAHSEYEHWVRRLYMTNMFNPVKLGLENIQRIHEQLGNPMDDPNVTVIHIAGTNGKGSVALKIAKTLEFLDDGLTVGLFCSPHVSSFRERMQINSELISEQEVVQYLPRIYEICQQHDIPATFFEVTTALAFLFYQQRGANVVVLETGLGGRLDSTNIVAQPACAVITSIGLEHTRILGDTVELIALEKGGIIKPNRPVLVGSQVPHDVLRQCARDKGASGYYTCEDILENEEQHQQSADYPDYDQENSRIAMATLRLLEQKEEKRIPWSRPIPDDILQRGTSARPPCRFEPVQLDQGQLVILDVAHNPPAMQYLMRKLRTTYPNAKFRIVVGMSRDKDTKLCAQYMLEGGVHDPEAIHLVQASHPRAALLEDILEASPELQGCHYDLEDRSVTRQIQLGLDRMTGSSEEILVVCGSVFLMAEAREALGFDEPRDSEYIAEVAGAHLRHGQENFASSSKKLDDDSSFPLPPPAA